MLGSWSSPFFIGVSIDPSSVQSISVGIVELIDQSFLAVSGRFSLEELSISRVFERDRCPLRHCDIVREQMVILSRINDQASQ